MISTRCRNPLTQRPRGASRVVTTARERTVTGGVWQQGSARRWISAYVRSSYRQNILVARHSRQAATGRWTFVCDLPAAGAGAQRPVPARLGDQRRGIELNSAVPTLRQPYPDVFMSRAPSRPKFSHDRSPDKCRDWRAGRGAFLRQPAAGLGAPSGGGAADRFRWVQLKA